MIEKKRPIDQDISDIDQEEDALDAQGQAAFEDGAPHEEQLYPEYDEEESHDLDGDIDPDAEAATRKRKANMIFYGGLAAAVVVIGFLGYPQIKRTFFKEAPHQAAAGIPVPLKARESKFTLADTTNSPEAPGGAMATSPAGAMPATSNPSPAPEAPKAADTSAVVPSPAPSVAVAPPPVMVMPPAVVAPQQAVTTPSPVPAAPVQGAAVSVPSFQPVSNSSATNPQIDQAQQTHIADLDGKISALQASIASLNAEKQQTAAVLQQIESNMDSLQKQIAGMSAEKPKAHEAVDIPAAPKASSHKMHAQAGSSNWTLRSAMTGMALLGQSGTGDLKRVSVGDTVPGLGKILSISEQNGQWVVKGTSGSVVQ